MAVIGASPVTFISEDTAPGKQYQVPLSLLTFNNSTGTIDLPHPWPDSSGLKTNDQAVVKALLKSLLSQGFLSKPQS